eukprot:sb/3471123/
MSYKEKMELVETTMVDVFQSERWQALNTNTNDGQPIPTITITINIDGVSLSNSSNASLHPLMVSVLDLPPALRESHIMAPFFFIQTKDTQFDDHLLKMFVDEVNILSSVGFVWEAWGKSWKTVVKPFCLACDAPMKAKILCIKGHAGYNSCPNCNIVGKRFDNRTVFPADQALNVMVERELYDAGQVTYS